MKIKAILISICVLAVLSITAYSATKIAASIGITNDITLQQIQDCKTITWDEEEPIYGTCTHYYNETTCTDPPINQSCSTTVKSYNYECQTGTKTNTKSKEVCKDKEIKLDVNQQKTYSLDYGEWGKCSYANENEVLVITCDSRLDGNNDGICQSGESCMQFRITKDSTQTLIKNSRDDFVENDKTFFLEKLSMKEVQ